MATTVKYPHIESPDGESPRFVRVPRVRVAQVIMDSVAHGWSAEDICRQHDYLTAAEVHAAFAYYFDNQDVIDKEMEEDWQKAQALAEEPHRSPFWARLQSQRRS
jgi:uncharacterized protein (DUF433 family)